jgi:hypothetical protein
MAQYKLIRINGIRRRFKQAACHTSPGAARAQASGFRHRGRNARVLKSGKHYCVYVGSKIKK